MRTAIKNALLGTCVLLPLCASSAFGSVISFDPDGPGPLSAINVASFDLLPGSSLNQTVVGQSVGGTTTVMFQARLGNFLDSTGHVIQVAGLNDSSAANPFQITVTAEFNLTITAQTTAAGTQTTVLALAPTQPTNFVHYYYNAGLTAVDLAGTGFTDGTLILAGSATSVNSVFTTLTSVAPSTFDNFGNNDDPGVTSISGIGGTTFTADSFTTMNSAWFKTTVSQLAGNTTNALPYNQADPSKKFFGTTTPNIGTVNGVSGPDIEFQTDAVTSFTASTVPEPASLGLLGIGALSLLSRRRRK